MHGNLKETDIFPILIHKTHLIFLKTTLYMEIFKETHIFLIPIQKTFLIFLKTKSCMQILKETDIFYNLLSMPRPATFKTVTAHL